MPHDHLAMIVRNGSIAELLEERLDEEHQAIDVAHPRPTRHEVAASQRSEDPQIADGGKVRIRNDVVNNENTIRREELHRVGEIAQRLLERMESIEENDVKSFGRPCDPTEVLVAGHFMILRLGRQTRSARPSNL